MIGVLLTLTDIYINDTVQYGDKGYGYFSRIERLFANFHHLPLQISFLNMKGILLSINDKKDEAVAEWQAALVISKKLGMGRLTQHLLLRIYDYHLERKEYLKALKVLDEAEAAYPDFLHGESTIRYAEVYEEMGQYEKAHQHMSKTLYYVDSANRARQADLIAEWDVRFNTKENELQIAQQEADLQTQKTQNRLLWGGAILLIIVAMVILYAFTVQRRAKKTLSQQNQVIEKQAAELRQLDQLKSRFFANVSHELRTPLTLMLGPVNSLLKKKEKENDEKKLLQFIQRNALQLQKLINEILDLSKLEDNKLEVVEEPVHFYPYLKDQMAQFHSFATNNQLGFEMKFQSDESLQILLDKNKFEKILHNFLSNALKFTPPKGEVVLNVNSNGDHLQLSVSDSGKGVHPDDLPHIFDRFYQSKQPDAKTEGGTGIGLSLCKELAGLLGGEVWAESELGKGSVFYFQFPKKAAGSGQGAGESPQSAPVEKHTSQKKAALGTIPPKSGRRTGGLKADGLKPTILIVEDNADLREYLQFLLSDYNILTAENGRAALELLSLTVHSSTVGSQGNGKDCRTAELPTVDLIISDLMMPVMDGFQLLERLKSDDRWRHLPTLMLTAKVNARAKLKALRIGVDDYLTKPFQEEELKARIENLLRNYSQRMGHFSKNGQGQPAGQTEKAKPVIAQVDAEWLEEVEKAFQKTLNDSSLKLDWIATKLYISQRQLQRRLQQLTGLSPTQYLHEMRMAKAYDFLVEGKYATVKEVSFAVGIRDTKYFSKRFQERFGASPSVV